ncbi:MAG TPA: VWA domain-containing protein [Polyangiaceae bacterium]|nr:VWA domain-containing protein [Polyangiaceae bacterium]
MNLAAPAFLAALGLLLPVAAAFLVKQRRRIVRVPSTLLWRQAALARSKNRRLRDLHKLLALAACLLGVAALALAAARPSFGRAPASLVFVVDVSASMDAGGRTSPLARARAELSKFVARRPGGHRYAVVAAGAAPLALAGLTDSDDALAGAVAGLRAERGTADLGAAVRLASALVAGEPGGRVVVFTDGVERAGDLASESTVPLTQRHLATPALDNVGLVSLSLHTPRDSAGAGERDLRASVATSSARERRVRVVVSSGGAELARRVLTLRPQGESDLSLRVEAAGAELRARVEPDDGLPDVLAGDDEASVTDEAVELPRAWLFQHPPPAPDEGDKAESPDAFFVRKALEAAGVRDVQALSYRSGARWAEIRPNDLVVTVGNLAPYRRFSAPTLFVGASAGQVPVPGLASIDRESGRTRLRSVESGDPLLEGVSLDEVTVEQAYATKTVPEGAKALVEFEGGAAVLRGGVGPDAWVYLGLVPTKSDVVLRVAFPVLVANAVSLLSGVRSHAVAETLPRSEVLLQSAPLAAVQPEPPPGWVPGFRPSTLLAMVAVALLGAEGLAHRKGRAQA